MSAYLDELREQRSSIVCFNKMASGDGASIWRPCTILLPRRARACVEALAYAQRHSNAHNDLKQAETE